MVLPGRGDAIRVVPLHLPDGQAAVPPSPPRLSYRGGPLMPEVEVFTVFWGAAWQQMPQSDMLTKINDFFDFILASPLIAQLAEYSVSGYAIGQGRRTGTATLTAPRLHHTVSDNAIQHMLQQEIAMNAAFPQPSQNTLYSSTCRLTSAWSRVGELRARCSAAIIMTSTARSSMP